MKRLFLFALLLAACSDPLQATRLENARRFEQANQGFLEAKTPEEFLEVAAVYRDLAGELPNGILHYNLGNAYVRAGRWGDAIAAYRQAERYRPRDPYLVSNLRFAQSQTTGVQAGDRSLYDHIFFWESWLSYPGKFTLLMAVATLTFLLGLAARLTRRRILRVTAVSMLCVTILLAVSAGRQTYDVTRVIHGVVTADEIAARKGNAESYEPAFKEPLGIGTEFTLLERRGAWLHVRLAKGQQAWIPAAAATTYGRG